MKQLIELVGNEVTTTQVELLKLEFPKMDEDWYVRQVIRTHIFE